MRLGIVLSGIFAASICVPASAKAQVVTSFFAPVAPSVTAVPVTSPTVIGSIPVRRGLFGLRTEQIPVFAPVNTFTASPVFPAATYTVARPVFAGPGYSSPVFAGPGYSSPGYSSPGFSSPVTLSSPPAAIPVSAYSSGAFAFPIAPAPMPNAVIQSGFRGVTPTFPSNPPPVFAAPSFAPPVFATPGFATPINTFFPGAVMTMQ